MVIAEGAATPLAAAATEHDDFSGIFFGEKFVAYGIKDCGHEVSFLCVYKNWGYPEKCAMQMKLQWAVFCIYASNKPKSMLA